MSPPPAQPGPAVPPAPTASAPYYAPAPQGPGAYPPPEPVWPRPSRPPSEGAAVHLKMAGVFNIIAGVLSFAYSVLMIIEIGVFAWLASEGEFDEPDAPPAALLIAIFVVLFLLSTAAGVIQLLGGIALLKRSRSARSLGMAAAITSLASIWNCWAWVLCGASGVYTLVILQKREVIELLATARS